MPRLVLLVVAALVAGAIVVDAKRACRDWFGVSDNGGIQIAAIIVGLLRTGEEGQMLGRSYLQWNDVCAYVRHVLEESRLRS